jgi:hypothetical protein
MGRRRLEQKTCRLLSWVQCRVDRQHVGEVPEKLPFEVPEPFAARAEPRPKRGASRILPVEYCQDSKMGRMGYAGRIHLVVIDAAQDYFTPGATEASCAWPGM